MFNSPSANRRLANRTVKVQVVVAATLAIAFLMVGMQEALAAALGGGAVSLGSFLLGWRAMPDLAWSAGQVLARMVSGLLLKWFVVVAVLYLGLAQWGLPPVPLLCGLVGTLLASFPFHAMKS